jgi:hypothetical protein
MRGCKIKPMLLSREGDLNHFYYATPTFNGGFKGERGDTPPPQYWLIISNIVLICGMRQNTSKIFYIPLSHDIGSPKRRSSRGLRPLDHTTTTTTSLLWTRWGPRPLAYFTPPNSKVGSAPGFDTGARSHPQLDAIPLCVVRGD